MKIAIIGVGRVGRIVAAELNKRGHYVVGIDKFADMSLIKEGCMEMHACEIGAGEAMVALLSGCDVAFNTISPDFEHPETYGKYIQEIIAVVKEANVSRLVSIVGSSSALVNSGERLVDSDYFDETNREFYLNICRTETLYQREKELPWTCITPAAFMELPEPVRGTYRKRYDNYLVTRDDTSKRYFDVSEISLTDFAYACCDELELPSANHQRICVAY